MMLFQPWKTNLLSWLHWKIGLSVRITFSHIKYFWKLSTFTSSKNSLIIFRWISPSTNKGIWTWNCILFYAIFQYLILLQHIPNYSDDTTKHTHICWNFLTSYYRTTNAGFHIGALVVYKDVSNISDWDGMPDFLDDPRVYFISLPNRSFMSITMPLHILYDIIQANNY